jgi:lysophospholipase L1-like esterase
MTEPVGYARYVALGDSQTEGLGDGDELRGYRGWADRLAEELAAASPGLCYANLAVRGLLAAQVRDLQLGPALELQPDLATVMAGMNDLIRPGFSAAEVTGCLEDMFAALTAAGARVVTITFPDLSKITPLARPLLPRVLDLNAGIRDAAARHGVIVIDTFPHAVTTDSRIWSADRLHLSPLGHARVAGAMANALDLPGSDDAWNLPLPAQPARPAWKAVMNELRWLAAFTVPWMYRHARGRSSGDGRTAKRPRLTPVSEPGPAPDRA